MTLKVIDSDHWVDVSYLQVSFQLYIKARDSDPGFSSDDDLDDIFIGHTLQLEANTESLNLYFSNM